MTVPTSVDGNVRRWDVSARPRPREHPVMRYEAMWNDERMKDGKMEFREEQGEQIYFSVCFWKINQCGFRYDYLSIRIDY